MRLLNCSGVPNRHILVTGSLGRSVLIIEIQDGGMVKVGAMRATWCVGIRGGAIRQADAR